MLIGSFIREAEKREEEEAKIQELINSKKKDEKKIGIPGIGKLFWW